jgi:hypothetical protein
MYDINSLQSTIYICYLINRMCHYKVVLLNLIVIIEYVFIVCNSYEESYQ